MLFKLTNNTSSLRYVWAHRQQVPILPGESRTLDLTDNNAVFLRRCEKQGDLFRIESIDLGGKEILVRANTPLAKRSYPDRLGPDAESPGAAGAGEPKLSEAAIRELAKQPDPGMRPVRVPRA